MLILNRSLYFANDFILGNIEHLNKVALDFGGDDLKMVILCSIPDSLYQSLFFTEIPGLRPATL